MNRSRSRSEYLAGLAQAKRVMMLPALAMALTLAGCAGESDPEEGPQPATIEEVSGSEAPVITLTEKGAERTGIETTQVGSASPLAIPYSALLYHPNGDTWVYASPEPLKFTREPVTVDAIDGDQVMLIDGPAPGTEIVTVGIAELYGVELGIGQ